MDSFLLKSLRCLSTNKPLGVISVAPVDDTDDKFVDNDDIDEGVDVVNIVFEEFNGEQLLFFLAIDKFVSHAIRLGSSLKIILHLF